MKKITFSLAFLMLTVFVLPGFMTPQDSAIKVKFPKKVDSIIQNKCYGCHSPEGRSQKAKNKLNWDELTTLDMATQLQKVEAIQKVLQEGTMPPKGMIEKNPDMKISDEESAKLEKWANKLHRKISRKMP